MLVKGLLKYQTLFYWLQKSIIFFIFLLAACEDKTQNEEKAINTTEALRTDTTQKSSIQRSDTIISNSATTDSIVEIKTIKKKLVDPPYPVCHPYFQTILLPNKQLKGHYNSEIGVGKNLVASIFYDNDLMMCGDVADGWHHQGIAIEFLNFQKLKAGTIYKLPNENLKISSSVGNAWRNYYYEEIGGEIIFQKLGRNLIAASLFLIDPKTHRTLLNRRNVLFTLKSQKFDEPKVHPFLNSTEETAYISGLPPIPQPDPLYNQLNPPLDSATRAILRQEMEERNAPDPKDTTVYKVELEKKARFGRTGRLAYYLEKMDIDGLTTEVIVSLSYVIEKDGTLTRLKIETKPGALTKEQLDYLRRQIMIRYSKSWEPAIRYYRPVRSLVKEQIKLNSEDEF